MKSITLSFAIALSATASMAGAQQLPQPVPLGPVTAMSTEPMSSVAQVRALPGGRVLVHDLTGRRVLMFDSTFKNATVVADTTGATGNAYGSRLGGLIAYRGDSSLFVDPQSISMLVIDGSGKIVRTMAAPLPNEVNQLIGGQNGTPGFDPQGRLVYRAQLRLQGLGRGGTPGQFQMPQLPESSLVVRVDLKSRKVDTAATFRIPKINLNVTRDDNGRVMVTPTVNPIPWTDDWAMLADGTIAIVRGQDYRVDFVSPDGRVTAGPKIPFDWQRLSDEDKTKIIDSTRTAIEAQRAAQIAANALANPEAAKADSARNAAASGRQRATADGGGNLIIVGGRGGGPGPSGPIGFTPPPLQFVTPSEMPDYRPVFRQGASRGDEEGNLWIRTSNVSASGTEYDVIDNNGELKDRVLVPQGRVIAGFGPGGVVYLGALDVAGIAHVERALAR
ncbi:MAG: hypothetical protein ACREN6_03940 [Gemmatimonadaceae bacterium]